jgi:hypothetical protein
MIAPRGAGDSTIGTDGSLDNKSGGGGIYIVMIRPMVVFLGLWVMNPVVLVTA